MSDEAVFLDTNILVYAHDRDSGAKHATARECVERLWRCDRPPTISVQVLQEFYVNLARRLPSDVVRETVSDYLAWQVVDNDRELLVAAMNERDRWQLSFWDALILAAARRAGTEALWSEDFNSGQDYGGVRAVNPLTAAT